VRLPSDTTRFDVVFERPAFKAFQEVLLKAVDTKEMNSPSADQRSAFKSTIARAKKELQERDTAMFWLNGSGRIVRWTTAHLVHDSVVSARQRGVALEHFRRLVASAHFSDWQVLNTSILARPGEAGGGSVGGTVSPDTVGWYQAPKDVYISTEVECEARREQLVTRASTFLALDSEPSASSHFLCLWFGREGAQWDRIRPTSFRVRLLAKAGRDSVAGPWVDVVATLH
jgi:hypothetical protein